jgi:hypothetical protein
MDATNEDLEPTAADRLEKYDPTLLQPTITCLDIDTLEQFDQYRVEGYQDAFKRAAMETIITGQCILPQKGERVFRDNSTFSRLGLDSQTRRNCFLLDGWR